MTQVRKTNPTLDSRRHKPKDAGCLLVCVFFCFLAAACGPVSTPTPFIAPSSRSASSTPVVLTVTSEPVTVTPTLTATSLPEPSLTPEPPSPTPACTASLKYLEDVTLPDGTAVSPGQTLEKQWRVENNGSCDWDARYRLKLVDGYPPLGASGEQAIFPARAGTQAVLTINFTAPLTAGTYRTAWQAYTPDGTAFGDPVYLEIVVGQ